MKHTHVIILLLATVLLSVVLCGCGGARHDDGRLVAIDSLLRHNPDSALLLLEQIDGSRLSNAGDRAYHALLLTQARYRCYVVATSDSAINIALDYYKRHHADREKLTRAYIYKGAVMEELGQGEAAMQFYKDAKSIASADDAFNQGYIRLRMGNIYRDNLVADSIDIELFKEALQYFKQVPDSFYILTCVSEIGSSYSRFNHDSALVYLEQAQTLAIELDNADYHAINELFIAKTKMFSSDSHEIATARDIVVSLLKRDESLNGNSDALMTAAYALSKLDKPDSALIYLNRLDGKLLSANDSVFYYTCRAEIARCHGDIDGYQHYYEKSNQLADSLVVNDMQRQLREVEAKYDNEVLEYEALNYKNKLRMSVLSALLAIGLLALLVLWLMQKSRRRKRELEANEDIIEQLHNDSVQLSRRLAEHEAMSDSLKATIHSQIDTFARLMEMYRKQYPKNPSQFLDLFKKTYSVVQPKLSFWKDIRGYADSLCNNVVTHTLEEHPSLRESDVRFLSLCCCDLPTTVIMACMGYNDSHSFYNKKRRLAEMIGLDGSLDDYIEEYRNRP